MRRMQDKPVYSTDPNFCPACRRSPCLCADPQAVKKRQPEPLRISFVRGVKGSGVTRVERLILHPTLKEEMLSALKKCLGCGGAVKEGSLELQGDHRDFLETELKSQGYRIKGGRVAVGATKAGHRQQTLERSWWTPWRLSPGAPLR